MNQTANVTDNVTEIAERYYDSSDADNFYFRIWGGEDIHIGLYQSEDEPIRDASRRTVETMASMVSINSETTVLDAGAGYGGAARYLSVLHGCPVVCLNLSKTQNERNREMTQAAGLDDRIRVVDGAFEDIPRPDASVDLVWSQDAFLHSGNKPQVFSEISRVLKPGGHLVFTDPMQADDCPDGVLGPVLARIHLSELGSIGRYRSLAREVGLEEVEVRDESHQLPMHYSRVRAELERLRSELSGAISGEYLDRMTQGLGHWIEAGRAGYLAWGILHFQKR